VLFPQQFVNVQLLVDTLNHALVIPNAAIQQGSQGPFVYVVNDNHTVSVRLVGTGPVEGEQTVITSGLHAGENVVIDGVDRLRDGALIQVREGPDRSPQGQAPSATSEPSRRHQNR